jgi:hypothetical protein
MYHDLKLFQIMNITLTPKKPNPKQENEYSNGLGFSSFQVALSFCGSVIKLGLTLLGQMESLNRNLTLFGLGL